MCGSFYTVSEVEDDEATLLQPFQSTPYIMMSSIICTKPIPTIDPEPEPTVDSEPELMPAMDPEPMPTIELMSAAMSVQEPEV